MTRRLVPLLLLVVLTGCVEPTPKDPSSYYGPVPSNIEAQVKEWADANLKDGESARYKFGVLQKVHYRDGLFAGNNLHYGWAQRVDINSKNSYGAYEGYEPHFLFFENGTIFADIQDRDNGIMVKYDY